MSDLQSAYAVLQEEFVTWAMARADIRAAHIIGSRRSSTQTTATEWSDLDILFYTTQPLTYRTNPIWIEEFRPVWLATYDDRGEMLSHWSARFRPWTLFVTLDGGLAVDFMIVHNLALIFHDWKALIRGTANGLPDDDILLDKDGRLRRSGNIKKHAAPQLQPPTEAEFLWVVHEFLGVADRAVRKLGSGDLYEAKRLTDVGLKRHLIRMLQWHTNTRQGWDVATDDLGRLETWADPRAVRALCDSYAHYNMDDIKRAMKVTIELFRWVAIEVAENQNHTFPHQTDQVLSDWIEAQLPRIQ